MNKTTIEWTDYTWNPVTGCNIEQTGRAKRRERRKQNRNKF